ncbi:hypothetical protein HDV05_006373 [Chytridiales sp. JEL 0842]|nr:hypothetical protein HDV05_006373 [Chytridiales sp. JEL 0842]
MEAQLEAQEALMDNAILHMTTGEYAKADSSLSASKQSTLVFSTLSTSSSSNNSTTGSSLSKRTRTVSSASTIEGASSSDNIFGEAAEMSVKDVRFIETVRALQTIVDGRLYKVHQGTLKDYFKTRWNISRAQVYRLFDCGLVIRTLEPHFPPHHLPTRERLCRILKQLGKTPMGMRILWASVLVHSGVVGVLPTSTVIQSVCESHFGGEVLDLYDASDPENGEKLCIQAGLERCARCKGGRGAGVLGGFWGSWVFGSGVGIENKKKGLVKEEDGSGDENGAGGKKKAAAMTRTRKVLKPNAPKKAMVPLRQKPVAVAAEPSSLSKRQQPLLGSFAHIAIPASSSPSSTSSDNEQEFRTLPNDEDLETEEDSFGEDSTTGEDSEEWKPSTKVRVAGGEGVRTRLRTRSVQKGEIISRKGKEVSETKIKEGRKTVSGKGSFSSDGGSDGIEAAPREEVYVPPEITSSNNNNNSMKTRWVPPSTPLLSHRELGNKDIGRRRTQTAIGLPATSDSGTMRGGLESSRGRRPSVPLFFEPNSESPSENFTSALPPLPPSLNRAPAPPTQTLASPISPNFFSTITESTQSFSSQSESEPTTSRKRCISDILYMNSGAGVAHGQGGIPNNSVWSGYPFSTSSTSTSSNNIASTSNSNQLQHQHQPQIVSPLWTANHANAARPETTALHILTPPNSAGGILNAASASTSGSMGSFESLYASAMAPSGDGEDGTDTDGRRKRRVSCTGVVRGMEGLSLLQSNQQARQVQQQQGHSPLLGSVLMGQQRQQQAQLNVGGQEMGVRGGLPWMDMFMLNRSSASDGMQQTGAAAAEVNGLETAEETLMRILESNGALSANAAISRSKEARLESLESLASSSIVESSLDLTPEPAEMNLKPPLVPSPVDSGFGLGGNWNSFGGDQSSSQKWGRQRSLTLPISLGTLLTGSFNQQQQQQLQQHQQSFPQFQHQAKAQAFQQFQQNFQIQQDQQHNQEQQQFEHQFQQQQQKQHFEHQLQQQHQQHNYNQYNHRRQQSGQLPPFLDTDSKTSPVPMSVPIPIPTPNASVSSHSFPSNNFVNSPMSAPTSNNGMGTCGLSMYSPSARTLSTDSDNTAVQMPVHADRGYMSLDSDIEQAMEMDDILSLMDQSGVGFDVSHPPSQQQSQQSQEQMQAAGALQGSVGGGLGLADLFGAGFVSV